MEKQIKKKRQKPCFVFDVNLEFKLLKRECNDLANFKSLIQICHNPEIKDAEFIEEANKKDLHIITHNTSDFQHPNKNIKIGIICIGSKADDDWIPKFKKLLKLYSKHDQFYNKTILINDKTTCEDRITQNIKSI